MPGCSYGGRIDNEFDQKLLQATLADLFVPQAFDADFALVKEWTGARHSRDGVATCQTVLRAPEGTTRAQFLAWVSKLPAAQSPVWLGLPAAAESRMLEQQGASLLHTPCLPSTPPCSLLTTMFPNVPNYSWAMQVPTRCKAG